MTEYELLNTTLSLIAIGMSSFSLYGQRKIKRAHRRRDRNAFIIGPHKIVPEDAENVEGAEEEQEEKKAPEIIKKKQHMSVELVHYNGNHYGFEISNNTKSDVKDVEMELLLKEDDDNPLNLTEFNNIFPIQRFAKNSTITLSATLYSGSPSIYNVVLGWTTPDGSRVKDELRVVARDSLPPEP